MFREALRTLTRLDLIGSDLEEQEETLSLDHTTVVPTCQPRARAVLVLGLSH